MAGADVFKVVSPGVRRLLLFISGLAFVVGPLLYLLPDQTDRLFAWTIVPPLTAAFLGSCYTTALILELLASRERIWARIRVFYPSMLLFTTVTLIATLLHLDRFHFASPNPIAKATAYLWTIIYVAAPIVMLGLLLQVSRQPGRDPPRAADLPTWFRLGHIVEGIILLAVGIWLFVTPASAIQAWPWSLTPLTARAIGAWGIALGFASVHAAFENTWERSRLAFVGNLAFAVLQLTVVARFASSIRWDLPAASLYLVILLALALLGLFGVVGAQLGPQSARGGA